MAVMTAIAPAPRPSAPQKSTSARTAALHATIESIQAQAASMCGVDAAVIQDIYPCTPLQEGVLALSSKQPGAYIAQKAFNLPVDLDLSRFQEAWELTVKDTPILRTRIVETREQGLLQVVLNEAITWSEADNLEAYLAQDSEESMRLGSRLVRHAIVHQAGSGLIFILTAHHAVYDGWTMSLVLERVEKYYQGALPTPSTPYTWFIQSLRARKTDKSAQFWQSQLADASCTQFPQLPSPQYQASADAKVLHSTQLTWKLESDVTSSTIIRAAVP